jgi:hypothetical protein
MASFRLQASGFRDGLILHTCEREGPVSQSGLPKWQAALYSMRILRTVNSASLSYGSGGAGDGPFLAL